MSHCGTCQPDQSCDSVDTGQGSNPEGTTELFWIPLREEDLRINPMIYDLVQFGTRQSESLLNIQCLLTNHIHYVPATDHVHATDLTYLLLPFSWELVTDFMIAHDHSFMH